MKCIHRIFPIVLAISCWIFSPTYLNAANQEYFNWRQEVINRDDVQRELSRLYLHLYEKKTLPTRYETIRRGDNPSDVVIRAGAWPKWLVRGLPAILDSLLCDLNPDICKRTIRSASKEQIKQGMHSISGIAVSTGNWTKAWAGRKMRVPDVRLKLTYNFGVKSPSKLGLSRLHVKLVETADFLQLFCRKFPRNKAHCGSRNKKGAWEASEPTIYHFLDDGRVDLNRFKDLADPSFLRKIGSPKSQKWLVAIPTLDVDMKIESNKLKSLIDGKSNNLTKRILVQRPARIESSKQQRSINALKLMRLIQNDGQPFLPWPSTRTNIKPIRILHVDEEAQLDHCMFRKLVQLGRLELRRWDGDGTFILVKFPPLDAEPEALPVSNTEATNPEANLPTLEDTNAVEIPVATVSDVSLTTGSVVNLEAGETTTEIDNCGTFNPIVLAQGNHGTHTLGLLAKLALAADMDASASANPNNVDPPLMIFHVPVPTGPDKTRALIDALENLAFNKLDLVNISLSWPRSGSTPLVDAIKDQSDVLFIAPAGTGDEDVSCSIVPACIDSKNVISVVALDHKEDGSLTVLEGTNIGAKFHEIGAIGATLVAPVAGDQMGALSGTSQATPIVTSVVSYLMRMGVRDFKQIKRRLITTAILDNSLLHASSATLINAQQALNDLDFVRLSDGCEMNGKFENLDGDDTVIRSRATETGASEHQIRVSEILRIFYNDRTNTRLIMDISDHKLRRQNYRLKAADLDRVMSFTAKIVKNCGSRQANRSHDFPLSDVRDFIRKLI